MASRLQPQLPIHVSTRPVVAGVGISHPDRVLFSAAGATKLDLARYYAGVGDWMLPHVVDRPLTLVRCPAGVRPGSDPGCFFMRHSKVWAPQALRRVRIQEKTKLGEYLVADSLPALVSLVQMDVIEIHTWNTRDDDVERPDRIVFDLDPGPEVARKEVIAGARLMREALLALRLRSFVKTTGGRGLHVVVPLARARDWSECLTFSRALAEAVERKHRKGFTTRYAKAGREAGILAEQADVGRDEDAVALFAVADGSRDVAGV